MGALIPVSPKAVAVQGFQLTNYQDMLDALAYLSTRAEPYIGSINCQMIDGAMAWWLTFVNPAGKGSGTGYVGDWIILENGLNASVIKAAEFDTFYTVT